MIMPIPLIETRDSISRPVIFPITEYNVFLTPYSKLFVIIRITAGPGDTVARMADITYKA